MKRYRFQAIYADRCVRFCVDACDLIQARFRARSVAYRALALGLVEVLPC